MNIKATHHKHSYPPVASFNDRLFSYTAVYLFTFAAFLVQAAALFPYDATNWIRLALIGSFIIGQVLLAAFAFMQPHRWVPLSMLMLCVMFGSTATVIILDKNFTEVMTDSDLDFSQLPAYLPLLTLGPSCSLLTPFNSLSFLTSNGCLIVLYFFTHLFSDRTVLIVCLESAVVAIHIGDTWRKAQPARKQLMSVLAIVKSFEEVFDESPTKLKTGLEYVLGTLKRVKKCLEVMMGMQSEEVKAITTSLVKSLAEVHQRIAETDLNSADAGHLAEIDPEDQQFIQQNYMQNLIAIRDYEPTAPGLIKPMNLASAKSLDRYEYEDLVSVLGQMGKSWNFNSFMLANLTESRPISAAGRFALSRYGLVERFTIDEQVYEALFEAIEERYRPNPYHNSSHAVDVMHSFMYLAHHSEIYSFFTSLETLGCLLACIAHDIGHFGVTNRFLMATKDPVAIKYNDYSVLEMMHVSQLFELLQEDDKNILKQLTPSEWQSIRKQIVEMILCTDMSRHFELLGKFRAFQAGLEIDALCRGDVRLEVYKITLKCADVGHAAKSNEFHQKWTSLICEEFFSQGDIERQRGLPISMYCDRDNTDLPKSQFGFIKELVIPLFEGLNSYLKSAEIEKHCIEQLKSNLAMWRDRQPVKVAKTILGREVDGQSTAERMDVIRSVRRATTTAIRVK
jgi:hypothetical protein